mgnify:CR=1 FL=1
MRKVTKAKVVRALRDAGFDVDIFYDRRDRQWCFCGPEADRWVWPGTLVKRLDEWDVETWVATAELKRVEACEADNAYGGDGIRLVKKV